MSETGKIILVGAGPGDPDLITLKGVKAIQEADVILYDALVSEEILDYAQGAEMVYVGKRGGMKQFSQDRINELIVEYAQKYQRVVRLKGGDSFVFGRGHEEALYAEQRGVKVEIVPGISSFYSVPELQGIPLTRRGINDSFWVVTGTTREHELSSDIEKAARSNATVVILMGMHKLEEICQVFIDQGKEGLPVAIIQNGSRPNERIVMGEVVNLVQVSKKNNMGAPAILVFGEVVRLHPDYLLDYISRNK